MDQRWLNFQTTVIDDLGLELAQSFVLSLHDRSNGDITKAARFYYELGQTWAPIIHLWKQWIIEVTTASKDPIALMMRDAKPLDVISPVDWKRLYINRTNCGIADELSGDEEKMASPLLLRYLRENGCTNGFWFVDSGCYGSIVLELHQLGINFNPLFFFSKNPNIPGFINQWVNEEQGTMLNDSFECCFPNLVQRPTVFLREKGVVTVPLLQTDELSKFFGEWALKGVADFKSSADMRGKEEIAKLLAMCEDAKTVFTGFLPNPTPEWSKKKEFLAAWPKELKWTI